MVGLEAKKTTRLKIAIDEKILRLDAMGRDVTDTPASVQGMGLVLVHLYYS